MRPLLISLVVAVCAPLAAQQTPEIEPKQRVRAVRELGKQGSETIPRIQVYLSDPVVDVRVEAVKAIVEIGTQRSLDALIQATRDADAEVQIRATDGLVNFYLPGYVQTGLTASLKRVGGALKSRWTDTNDQLIESFIQVRAEVVGALGQLAKGGVSMEARANAARAIGILRGRAAIPDLLEALRSKDDRVIYE
ncbi:MAG: HEAT repeat domain-containing protein, partial [Bryobacterales bacterium]|nr:HEAT repeat domain-containing protein [Bryobacterales bacterium]